MTKTQDSLPPRLSPALWEPQFDLASVLEELDAADELDLDDTFLRDPFELNRPETTGTADLVPVVGPGRTKTTSAPRKPAEKGGLAPALSCMQSDGVASRTVPAPLFRRAPKAAAFAKRTSPANSGTKTSQPAVGQQTLPRSKNPMPTAAPAAFRRTAQPSLTDNRRYAIQIVAAVLVAVAVLFLGGMWLFSGSSGPPQTRYLPRNCDQVISMKWSDVPPSDAASTLQELPGLMLVERCRLFVSNAGLRDQDVERINVGRAADGSGIVVVYQLARAVGAQVVADLQPFRSRRKSAGPTETIGGVPLYSLGPTVIAFPEPQVIVNGETELVRQILRRWSHGIAEPIRGYLQAADLAATSVVISAGSPQPLLKDGLHVPSHLADTVRGTTATFRYGDSICLTWTYHLGGAPTGDELQTVLQSSLGAVGQDPKTPNSLRKALTQAQISTSREQVQIELTLPATQLPGKSLEILNRLL